MKVVLEKQSGSAENLDAQIILKFKAPDENVVKQLAAAIFEWAEDYAYDYGIRVLGVTAEADVPATATRKKKG